VLLSYSLVVGREGVPLEAEVTYPQLGAVVHLAVRERLAIDPQIVIMY